MHVLHQIDTCNAVQKKANDGRISIWGIRGVLLLEIDIGIDGGGSMATHGNKPHCFHCCPGFPPLRQRKSEMSMATVVYTWECGHQISFFYDPPKQKKRGDAEKLLFWARPPCYLTNSSCVTCKDKTLSPRKSQSHSCKSLRKHMLSFKTMAIILLWRLIQHVLACLWSSAVLWKYYNKRQCCIDVSVMGK